MSFFSHLTQRVLKVDSLLCVGLDPHPEFLDQTTAGAAGRFCDNIIEATADLACAFKPNSAFFEMYGAEGWSVLKDVIEAVPDGIPVILDAKRGDIASTARAYAQAIFEGLGADAVTISPFLGRDALEPFLSDPEHGVFMLCKTSNPGSDDLQSLLVGECEPLYVHLARMALTWNIADNLGLVVGATDPAALAAVRAAAPDLWLLAPGVGAQGGDLEKAMRAGLRSDGLGMIVPVSRGIARAEDPRAEAVRLRDAIRLACRQVRIATPTSLLPSSLAGLADDLLATGCVRFGEFTLKSGQRSPIYLDLRILASYPSLLRRVAEAYRPLLTGLHFHRLAALPYAALPIGTTISLQTGWPLIYPRREIKDYGTQAAVEGVFNPGETTVLVDDLATTGGSKFEAIERLTAAGLKVRDVVVLIDRQGGASEALSKAGYQLHSVFTLSQMLDHWEMTQGVPKDRIEAVREYILSQQER
jgi:uridine monophosphate synthetase